MMASYSIKAHTGIQQQRDRAYHVQTRRLYADCMSDPGIGRQQFRYIDSDCLLSLCLSVCLSVCLSLFVIVTVGDEFNEWAYNRQWNFFCLCGFQLKDMEMCGEEWRIEEDNGHKKGKLWNFSIPTCPLDPYFIFMYMHYNQFHRATVYLELNILLLLLSSSSSTHVWQPECQLPGL